jgi:hypothetical protein
LKAIWDNRASLEARIVPAVAHFIGVRTAFDKRLEGRNDSSGSCSALAIIAELVSLLSN